MSDLIIRNFPMPEEGLYTTIRINSNGEIWSVINRGDYYYLKTNNVAVKLPPHGNLIDRDSLLSQLDGKGGGYCVTCRDQELIDLLNAMPVVLGANNG